MKLSDLIQRADELIQLGQTVLETRHSIDYGNFQSVDTTKFQSFRSASLSFLLSSFGNNHPYYREFDNFVTQNDPEYVRTGLGILQGARDEMAGGWTTSIKSIVSAEVFSDFLDMASYLLEEGYKDASAVMVGSILEEHLRQLCRSVGIDIEKVKPDGSKEPRKADSLNADLAKQGVYSLLDLKNVTAWLDLRNDAAHGHYEKYTREQVNNMARGVTEFIARVVA
jgi:hypothetical protein